MLDFHLEIITILKKAKNVDYIPPNVRLCYSDNSNLWNEDIKFTMFTRGKP